MSLVVGRRSKILLIAFALFFANTQIAVSGSQPYLTDHKVNFATGNRYLVESDYKMSGPILTFRWSREYNSQSKVTSNLGYGWAMSEVDSLRASGDNFIHIRSGGRHTLFILKETGIWVSGIGKERVLRIVGDSYHLTYPNGVVEIYNANGQMIGISDSNGNSQEFDYQGDKLTTMRDSFGRQIDLVYNGDNIYQTQTPVGTFTYAYDANNNLVSVTRPDSAVKTYIYDDPNDAHNLTGIIDETGTRTLTLTYDTGDRVTSSAKADGADQVTIAYPTASTREVTNSLGVTTTYELDILHGVAMVGSMTGPGCSSCGGSVDTSYLYNSRLQILEATDVGGTKTTYTYDVGGNNTTITKAFGTPFASTTTKTYDSATNQLLTITKPSVANPGQQTVTTMTYDPNGNLITLQQS
ncbi:MAG: RHS repeat protein, partial [Desulfobulbaceae bacterium]|nr:RHS repeat protein [Desulfobulbaceae bacterium]